MKIIKFLCFSLLCLLALSANAQYVDLGLPSGTKWKSVNETGGINGLYSYDRALATFGKHLPTREQFVELASCCTWSWISEGYKVTGPNGNFIVLPAADIGDCDGHVRHDDVLDGSYWSSTAKDSEKAWRLFFISDDPDIRYNHLVNINKRCVGLSVRLVQD